MRKNGRELTPRRMAGRRRPAAARRRRATDAVADAAPSPTPRELARQTGNGRYSEPCRRRRARRLIDYHLPLSRDGAAGSLVATYDLKTLLDETVPWWFAQDNAVALLDARRHVVAQRAAGGPGRGVYTHNRPLDLPAPTCCWPPTASRARRACCPTCWSAR